MSISLLTIVIITVIAIGLLVLAHSVAELPPPIRTLCLVVGWMICVALAAILFTIWLFTSLFAGKPVVLDDSPKALTADYLESR